MFKIGTQYEAAPEEERKPSKPESALEIACSALLIQRKELVEIYDMVCEVNSELLGITPAENLPDIPQPVKGYLIQIAVDIADTRKIIAAIKTELNKIYSQV